jgi:hypothetical protein
MARYAALCRMVAAALLLTGAAGCGVKGSGEAAPLPALSAKAPTPSAVPSPSPAASVDCATGDQLRERGLLAEAETIYAAVGAAACASGRVLLFVAKQTAAEEAAAGDAAMRRGDLNGAVAHYRAALRWDRHNAQALTGVSKAGDAAGSPAGRWAAGWDGFYAAWVAPMTRLVLVALAVLLVLLVLAQLATRRLAGASAPGWAHRRASWTWWSGLALMVAGSVLLTSALAAAKTAVIPLSAGIVVSLAGVAAAAAGIGRRLGLRVEVLGKDGHPDTAAMDYIVARLLVLGSARPAGLKAPQQTDVTSLPEDALSTLPQAKIAVSALKALQAILPTAPWTASVACLGNTQLTVTLSRNGSISQTQTIQWPPPKLAAMDVRRAAGADGAASQHAELLTAASAFILCELSQHHLELQQGLCGASSWQSLAAQAVATDPATKPGSAWQRELLAFAVESDPGNIAAHVAYTVALGRRGAGIHIQRNLLERLESINSNYIPYHDEAHGEVERGWQALALRVRYMIVAARLNLMKAHNCAAGDRSWESLRTAATDLIELLDKCSTDRARQSDEALCRFAEQMKPPTYFMWQSTLAAGPPGCSGYLRKKYPCADHWVKVKEVREAGFLVSLSLTAHYNLACLYAKDDPGLALDHLAYAVADDEIRLDAQTDPYFDKAEWQQKDPDPYKRFKEIVGDSPPVAFLDLAPFAGQKDKLAAIGIHNAGDLSRMIRLNRRRLATDLGLSVSCLEYWLRLSDFGLLLEPALARLTGKPSWLGWLDLLLAAGVDSTDSFRASLEQANGGPTLADRLFNAARSRTLVAPSDGELRQAWAELERIWPGRQPGSRPRLAWRRRVMYGG